MRGLAVLAFVASVGSLSAQSAPDAAEAARRTLRSDLRNVVTVQEAHFAEFGRYAPDVAAIASRFRPSEGVSIRFVDAATNSYGAIATSAALGDASCSIGIGLGPSDRLVTNRERRVYPDGMVACDGDVKSVEQVWREYSAQILPVTLRSLVKAQERHFGRTGAYAESASQLDGFRVEAGVRIEIEASTMGGRSTGFRASATHIRSPGVSCAIYAGFGPWRRNVITERDSVPATFELSAVCDDFKR